MVRISLKVADYADDRGCTRQSVYRAIREGRCPVLPDGTIDPAAADAAWPRHFQPSRRDTRARLARENAEARHGVVQLASLGRAIMEGRLPVEADGMIDFAKADAAWQRGPDWPYDDPPPLDFVPAEGALAALRAALCNLEGDLLQRVANAAPTLARLQHGPAVAERLRREVDEAMVLAWIHAGLPVQWTNG